MGQWIANYSLTDILGNHGSWPLIDKWTANYTCVSLGRDTNAFGWETFYNSLLKSNTALSCI